MTTKLAAALFASAVCLYAADFWTNIFTDWTDKDVEKMMENSPWAKKLEIATGTAVGLADRFRAGGIGGTRTPGSSSSAVGTGQEDSVTLYVRWQSALPVKQAAMRLKFGAEAGRSTVAQEILRTVDPNYLITVDGLTRKITGSDLEELKKTLMEQTALAIKSRNPIAPLACSITGQEKITAAFTFPKTEPIVLGDKDVEFQSKIGAHMIKQKFHLKDMVYFDKLAL